MKTRYILYRRGDMYCAEDTETGKQATLRTKDKAEALVLLTRAPRVRRFGGP